LARRWRISKRAKVERFGEQRYQVVYFSVVGVWGINNMLHSRTGWFDTRALWAAFPTPTSPAPLKAYYLTQIAYSLQQALVLALGLEKTRSGRWELVVHHVVTVWIITWSSVMNATLLENAVFVSMDAPDMLLALSKMRSYLRLERAKVVSFAGFVVGWKCMRSFSLFSLHLLLLFYIGSLYSLNIHRNQTFDLLPGLYMAPWVRDQMFGPLCVLQALNLFWFWLILRILYRTIMVSETDNNRSDAEEVVEECDEKEREKEALGRAEGVGVGLGASLAKVHGLSSILGFIQFDS
ncbi:TLC domain-containing protein, partial [Mycena galopus ATCC 62051]